MDDIKPHRKNRFEKGSEAAKEFMATLRAKKGKKTSTPPPAPPAPPASPPSPPASAGSIPSSLEPKRRHKKILL